MPEVKKIIVAAVLNGNEAMQLCSFKEYPSKASRSTYGRNLSFTVVLYMVSV